MLGRQTGAGSPPSRSLGCGAPCHLLVVTPGGLWGGGKWGFGCSLLWWGGPRVLPDLGGALGNGVHPLQNEGSQRGGGSVPGGVPGRSLDGGPSSAGSTLRPPRRARVASWSCCPAPFVFLLRHWLPGQEVSQGERRGRACRPMGRGADEASGWVGGASRERGGPTAGGRGALGQ